MTKIESQVSAGLETKQENVLQGEVSTYIDNTDLYESTFCPKTVLIATVLSLLEIKMPSSTSWFLQYYVSTENGSKREFMFSLLKFICKGKVTWNWMSQAGAVCVTPHLCCRSPSPETGHFFSTSWKAALWSIKALNSKLPCLNWTAECL